MRFVALIAGVLAFCLAAGEAEGKRVAVLAFRGPQAGRFQRAIAGYVGGRHALIRAPRYRRTARRMGAAATNPRNVRRVARRLRLDAVVTGSVRRHRGRYQLTVRVRSGKTGRFVGAPIRVASRRAQIIARDRRRVRRQLLRILSRVPVLWGGGSARDRDRDRDRNKNRDRDRNKNRDRRVAEELEEEELTEASDQEELTERSIEQEEELTEGSDEQELTERSIEQEEEPVRVAERDDQVDGEAREEASAPISAERRADLKARSRGLDVEAGLAGIVRNLGFNAAANLGDDAPQGYRGGLVPAFLLSAELYPLAFNLTTGGVTRNIGLSADFERVLLIKSKVPNMPNLGLPTTQQRFGAGVVYRHNFGSSPTSPTLKVSVRYNQAQFTIDRAPAEEMGISVDLPSVTYTYFDPGVGLRYPLGEKLALAALGRYLHVTDTGEMQQEENYGDARVTGFDMDAYAEYRFKPRLLLRAGARAMRFGFDFDGTGALTDRNGDMTQDVGGAVDSYFTGYATLVYLF